MDTLKHYAAQLWRSSDTKSRSTEIPPAIQKPPLDSLEQSVDMTSSTWSGYLRYLPSLPYLGSTKLTPEKNGEEASDVHNSTPPGKARVISELIVGATSTAASWSSYCWSYVPHFGPTQDDVSKTNVSLVETNHVEPAQCKVASLDAVSAGQASSGNSLLGTLMSDEVRHFGATQPSVTDEQLDTHMRSDDDFLSPNDKITVTTEIKMVPRGNLLTIPAADLFFHYLGNAKFSFTNELLPVNELSSPSTDDDHQEEMVQSDSETASPTKTVILPFFGRISMDETNESKLLRIMKQSPFVPIGILGLVGVCAFGAYRYKNRGGMSTSLYLMQLRVAAQGAVVGCMILGLAGSMINEYIMHPNKVKEEAESTHSN